MTTQFHESIISQIFFNKAKAFPDILHWSKQIERLIFFFFTDRQVECYLSFIPEWHILITQQWILTTKWWTSWSAKTSMYKMLKCWQSYRQNKTAFRVLNESLLVMSSRLCCIKLHSIHAFVILTHSVSCLPIQDL